MHAVPLVLAMFAYAAPVVPKFGDNLRRAPLLLVALALHAVGLAMIAIESRGLPVASLTEGLAAVSLLVAGGAFVFGRRPQMAIVSNSMAGLAALLLLGASVAHDIEGTESPTLFFGVHAMFVFTGFAGFAASFSLSGLYLVQRRRLQNKQFDSLGKLPSMDELDRLNLRAMIVGFVTLTAGALMGAGFALANGEVPEADVTVWATFGVWLWYALGLQARILVGWRGRLAAWFGVVGFFGVGLILAVIGVAFGGWHAS